MYYKIANTRKRDRASYTRYQDSGDCPYVVGMGRRMVVLRDLPGVPCDILCTLDGIVVVVWISSSLFSFGVILSDAKCIGHVPVPVAAEAAAEEASLWMYGTEFSLTIVTHILAAQVSFAWAQSDTRFNM